MIFFPIRRMALAKFHAIGTGFDTYMHSQDAAGNELSVLPYAEVPRLYPHHVIKHELQVQTALHTDLPFIWHRWGIVGLHTHNKNNNNKIKKKQNLSQMAAVLPWFDYTDYLLIMIVISGTAKLLLAND